MTYHNTTQSTTNAQGDIAPAGYHYMPDGSLMLDIEHTIKKIFSFTIDDTDLAGARSSRNLTITGDVGARFTLFISNEDIFKFYNFTTDVFATVETRLYGEIPSNGIYTKKIDFPIVTDDDKYDFQLTANTHHKTELAFGLDKVYYKASILQRINRTIQEAVFTSTSSDFQSLGAPVVIANKPPLSTIATTYALKRTIKAVDAATGGALKIIRQPIPTDFVFKITHESIGLGTAATASTNPTILYLDSVENLAINMTVSAIESSSVAGSPVVTRINAADKSVTLSVAQTWVTAKDITFQGKCGTPQLNSATGGSIEITDMSIELTPFTATVNDADLSDNGSTTITLDSIYGIRRGAGTAVTVTGIGLSNSPTQQQITGHNYGANTITVTSAQTLKDNTILTFEGCSKEAVFKAKIKVTKMPKENLMLQLQVDNILTSSTT